MFPGVPFPKKQHQGIFRPLRSNYCVQSRSNREGPGKLTVPIVAVAETQGACTRDPSEHQVRKS